MSTMEKKSVSQLSYHILYPTHLTKSSQCVTATKESPEIETTALETPQIHLHGLKTSKGSTTNFRLQPRRERQPTSLLAPQSRAPPALRKRHQRLLLHRRPSRLHRARTLVRRAQPPSPQQHASHAYRRSWIFLPLQCQAVRCGRHITRS